MTEKLRGCLGLFGNSMLPTLKPCQPLTIIQIKHCTYEDVKVGDIVSYWSDGFNSKGNPRFWHKANVVHRIIGKTSVCALIKGDNIEYVEKVQYNKINGKVKL